MNIHRFLSLVIFVLPMLLGGCLVPLEPTTRPASDNLLPAAPRTNKADTGKIMGSEIGARVKVYKFTLPLGTFSANEQLWRQLDEDALDSATSVLLARNGLRAAVGPQSRWPAIAKLIDVPGAAYQEFLCQTDGRSVILLPTRQNIPEQTVFYFDQEITQYGRTFGRCDNAVRLAMSKARGSSETLIQVEPVVQLGTVDMVRNPQEVGVVRTQVVQEETFANLRLGVKVKGENFLVVAPANPKGEAFSVGTRFFSETDKVPPVEIVLVFVPGK